MSTDWELVAAIFAVAFAVQTVLLLCSYRLIANSHQMVNRLTAVLKKNDRG